MKKRFVLPLLTLLAVGCATDPNTHFVAESLSTKELADFSNANVILIGEQHDNPAHHVIQEEIMLKLAEQGRLKSVVFEQVDWDNQGPLDYLSKSNVDQLPKKIEWATSGWPDYDMYRPLFETAVNARAKVIAGGLPKNRVPLLAKGNYEVAFSAAEMERLKIRTPLPDEAQALLKKEIFEGHCQMIPEDHVDVMIPVQRARDAALVKGYLNEADISGVTVFILGNGHARKDFGVPTLLQSIDPKLKIWSVGLFEEGSETPPAGAFDKIWVTEKAEREDPCQKMREHLDKKKRESEAKDEVTEEPKAEEEAAPAPEAEEDKAQAPDTENPASDDAEQPADDQDQED